MTQSVGRSPKPYETFGKYIKELRQKKAKLKGAEAARKLGLKNRQQLSNYERGRTLPSGPLLIELAKIYNCPPEEVLEKAYWPQMILLPLVAIIDPEQLSRDLIEQIEKGLEEAERQELTKYIEKLLSRRSTVSQR